MVKVCTDPSDGGPGAGSSNRSYNALERFAQLASGIRLCIAPSRFISFQKKALSLPNGSTVRISKAFARASVGEAIEAARKAGNWLGRLQHLTELRPAPLPVAVLLEELDWLYGD